MSMRDELASLDATAQAELVRKKEVTPVELVEAAIERIERVNPKLNAVVTPMFEQALQTARGALPEGPFKGVPFLLKDLLAAYGGVRMTMGSTLMRNFVPNHDTELVARLKRSGLVVVGKTNTPEFGILPTTEPGLFGASRNPWDPGRTTGGSSGGSAAAVAARMVPMAHANDGGGSIRIPASCCGLFGLKPTRARNPLGPDFGDIMSGLVCEHAVTGSVRDSAALLDATSGPAPGDPYWAPPPARPFAREVGADPGRLRIAFTVKAPSEDIVIHPDCVAAVREAAALCESLGHEVEEASPEIQRDMMLAAFVVIWAAGNAATLDAISLMTGRKAEAGEVEPLTWALCEMGRKRTASEYLMSVQVMQGVGREMARFFQSHDIWLTPTVQEPPVPLGTFDSTPEDALAGFTRSARFVPFTPVCNASGQPAMSMPLFWNADGLPIGTHFVARFGEEATLFRLASQLERARPWADRRPPICA